MRWWRKVRRADIPVAERDLFERYGEAVIASVLASGFNPRALDLHPLYSDSIIQGHARDWLTECRDTHIRKEQRVEWVEWAILAFVGVEMVISIFDLVENLIAIRL